MTPLESVNTDTASTGPLLRVHDLAVTFARRASGWGVRKRQVPAVDGISFEIAPGETFGLVGESGSGKSTTGRAILGLVGTSTGSIEFEGREVRPQGTGAGDLDFHRGIQAVFQDPLSSLNPMMRIGGSIAEPLRWLSGMGRNEREAEVSRLLELVGLDPSLHDRFPYQLSGGQRQRVAIARAIAPRPKLIVCDEAVSALDVSTQAQIINLLQDLQQELGIAYLFIAHDLDVVRHVSDRVGVLYRGALVEVGTAEQVHDRPTHPYTKSLLASVPGLDPRNRRLLMPETGEI